MNPARRIVHLGVTLFVVAGVGRAQLIGLGSQEWSLDGPLAGNAEAADHFGDAVAVGDFNGDGKLDLAVGSPDKNVGGLADAGIVNVVYGSAVGLQTAGTQGFESRHIFGHNQAADHFGSALAAGDLNGDDFDDLVIGAPGRTVSDGVPHLRAGRVYFLKGSAAGLVVADFNHPSVGFSDQQDANPREGDAFGSSVAILERCWFPASGDPRGGCIVVGSPGADFCCSAGGVVDNAGAITFIPVAGFLQQAPTPVTSITLSPGDAMDGVTVAGTSENGDLCGSSLAVGDFDGDGHDDVAFGCPFEDGGPGVTRMGGVVEVTLAQHPTEDRPRLLASASFTQDTNNVAGTGQADDNFGWALAAAHFDDDGVEDLVVGVPGEDAGSQNSAGAIVILYGVETLGLTGLGSALFSQDDMTGAQAEANDSFGAALAAADFDGDTREDLAVGAPFESFPSGFQDFAGNLTVFRGAANGLSATGMTAFNQSTDNVPEFPDESDSFASALAAGDFDGDGIADLAIGVPNEDTSGLPMDHGVVDVLYGQRGGAFSVFNFSDTGDLVNEFASAPIQLEVRRTGSVRLAASVTIALVTSPAPTATLGADFTFAPLTLSWAAGDASPKLHAYGIVNDSTDEPDERFRLTLQSPSSGNALGPGTQKLITIRDDDAAGQLFADGFESSDASRWSAIAP